MEEVAADILAANTPQAAAGIGMVEQRDVIVTPIRDNDQTKTTQNDQPQEELMQRSESDGDIPPRRRRIVPARFRSPTVSSSILRGASSKKRNLTGKMNSPARRNNGRHPSARTKAANEGTSRQGGNPQINLIPATNKKKEDFRVAPHPAP